MHKTESQTNIEFKRLTEGLNHKQVANIFNKRVDVKVKPKTVRSWRLDIESPDHRRITELTLEYYKLQILTLTPPTKFGV